MLAPTQSVSLLGYHRGLAGDIICPLLVGDLSAPYGKQAKDGPYCTGLRSESLPRSRCALCGAQEESDLALDSNLHEGELGRWPVR